MLRRRESPWLVGLVLLLGACSPTLFRGQDISTPTPRVEIEGADTLPRQCSRDQIATRIFEFVDAFNHGDSQRASTFFGTDFQWFSVDSRPADPFFVTYDRLELPAYFESRHVKSESWRLLRLSISPQGGAEVSLFYEVHRAAQGLDGVAHGKAVLNCVTGKIKLWSMASPGT